MNFIATHNIRTSEKDSEKNMVLCKKGDDITPFDGTIVSMYDHRFFGNCEGIDS